MAPFGESEISHIIGDGCIWSYPQIHSGTPLKVAPCDSDYKSAKIFEIRLFLSSNAPFFDLKSQILTEIG